MNWIRNNITYMALIVVAILLIGFVLRIQYLLWGIQAVNDDAVVTANTTAVALPTPIQVQQQPTLVIPTPTRGESTVPAETVAQSAVQSSANGEQSMSPEELLEIEMLGAANLTTSEEDDILVQLIKDNPLAIGFIRYSSYLRNQDTLRALKIEISPGIPPVEPNEDTVASGAYPFSRPLLIYSSSDAIQANPALEGYMGCYLNRVFDEIEDIGYTAPSVAMYRDALESFDATCERCQMAGSTNPLFPEVPACTIDNIPAAPLRFTGGTTVYSLSARMIELYRQAGFTGEISIEDIGTSNGFARFCESGDAELVNASRLVKDKEEALCLANGRELTAFPVGLDLVVVVVSRENPFVEQLSFHQLKSLFTNTLRWSDVDRAWPAEFITRAIPNKSRGTFSFFVEMLYAGASSTPDLAIEPPAASAVQIATATSSTAGAITTLAPISTSTPQPVVTDTPTPFVDYHLGYLEQDADCTLATEIMQTILQREFGRSTKMIPFASTDALFDQFTAADNQERIDWTLCYAEPDDRAYLEEYSSVLSGIGKPYRSVNNKEYQIVSYAAMKRVIHQEQPCIHSFLTNFTVGDDDLGGQTATDWVNEHEDLVQDWTSCKR